MGFGGENMASFYLSGSSVRFPPPSSPLSSSQAIPRFGRPNRIVFKISSQRHSPTSLGLRFSSLIFPTKSNLHEHGNMIGLTTHLHRRTCLPLSFISRPLSRPLKETHLYFPYGFLKSYAQRRLIRVLTLASNDNSNNNNNELRKDLNERGENGEKRKGLGVNGRDGLGKENGRSIFNSIRWGELLLNPDPDNILAVVLTGLLTWASIQVLWQLLFISLAILVAAIKIKGASRWQTGHKVFVAYLSNSNPSGRDSIDKKSDRNMSDVATAQGPPFLTILAGFLLFFLVIWIVGSIITWLFGLIVNLASPK